MAFKYLKKHTTTPVSKPKKKKKPETPFLFISFQFPTTEGEWIHVGNESYAYWTVHHLDI